MTTLATELAVDLEALGIDAELIDGLSEDQVEEVLVDLMHDDIEAFDLLGRAYPLAVTPLWVHDPAVYDELPEWAQEEELPEGACDQWTAGLAMLTDPVVVASGGNRAGKTFAAYCIDVAMALGRDHPAVEGFCALNAIDPELIPMGPGNVIVVARSAAHSRKTHRQVIDALLPSSGVKWYGKNALGEAFVEIEVPGYAKRARIDFMSADQGGDKFRGTDARHYHIDEEPLGPEGELVFKQCLRGAAGEGGTVVITATPEDGDTWMTRMMRDSSRCRYLQLDALGNYLVNSYEGLLRHLGRMDPRERRMRRFGDVVPREGLVYPQFQRGAEREGLGHTCDPFDIPADWTWFRGADFGLSNPTCVLWGVLGDDNTLYIVREHYEDHTDDEDQPAPKSYEEIGHEVHRIEGATRGDDDEWDGHTSPPAVERSWGDPSAKGALKTWRRLGLTFSRADNDVAAGLSKVAERMRVLEDGRPRIKIFSTCPNLIREIGVYRRDPKRRDGAPIKKDDHAVDALRYLVMGVDRWLGD